MELAAYKGSDDEDVDRVVLNQGDAFRMDCFRKYKFEGALDWEIIITLTGN